MKKRVLALLVAITMVAGVGVAVYGGGTVQNLPVVPCPPEV